MSHGAAAADAAAASRPVTAHDPLRLERCPVCGYRLEGLMPRGVCPECGTPYDDNTIILHGWSRGTHERATTGTRRAFVGFMVLLLFQVLNATVNLAVRGTLFSIFVLACCAAAALYVVWRRFATDLPGLIQVHLSAEGCRQINNPKSNKRPSFTPWRAVNDLMMGPESPDVWRVRFRHVRAWWRRPFPIPVDAVVHCTDEQGWALRERVAAWRNADGVLPPGV
jgi:hypothetical protein